MPVSRLVLLPGMHGTEKLFPDFMQTLPADLHKEALIYPAGQVLSYGELTKLVRSACENSPPFVILAESFSTPLAIRVAAENPPNLKGVILCAGFASSPVPREKRWLAPALVPLLARAPLSDSAIRTWLLNPGVPDSLVADVRAAIRSIEPAVLVARMREVLHCDVRKELSRVAVPLLYLHANHDRLLESRALEEIRRVRPALRAQSFDGPHFLLQCLPDVTSQAVANFLAAMP